MRAPLLALVLLGVAACSQDAEAPVAEPAANEATATEAPPATEASPPPAGIPEFGIPEALQGRWGLVPADCTSTRGDAKGLLVVSATTLTFYESLGRLQDIAEQGDTSIRAKFAFTGEGQEWQRDMQLAANGDTMTRTEFGADALAQPLSYTRCE